MSSWEDYIQNMILCGYRFLGRNLFRPYKSFFSYVQNEERCHITMLHSSSPTQSALVSASPHTLKGDFQGREGGRVADATPNVGRDIHVRVVVDFMALLEVVGVAQVEEPSLRLIILP
jgi:hypothetical protein